MKAKRPPIRQSVARLQRLARDRADEQARHVPWRLLYDTRNLYVSWQEFYLWVRSILETEGQVPDWLVPTMEDRCPGFLQAKGSPSGAQDRPLLSRLEDWIDEQIFGFTRTEGWFNAVA